MPFFCLHIVCLNRFQTIYKPHFVREYYTLMLTTYIKSVPLDLIDFIANLPELSPLFALCEIMLEHKTHFIDWPFNGLTHAHYGIHMEYKLQTKVDWTKEHVVYILSFQVISTSFCLLTQAFVVQIFNAFIISTTATVTVAYSNFT